MVKAPADTTGRVVVGQRGAWVAESVLGVGRIAPATRHLQTHAISIGSQDRLAVDEIAVGAGKVWLEGAVTRPSGLSPSAPQSPGGFVVTKRAAVVVLDERTGRRLGNVPLPARDYEVALGSNGLILADFREGRVFNVDASGVVRGLKRLRHGSGTLVAVTPGAIWVTTASGMLRRISLRGA